MDRVDVKFEFNVQRSTLGTSLSARRSTPIVANLNIEFFHDIKLQITRWQDLLFADTSYGATMTALHDFRLFGSASYVGRTDPMALSMVLSLGTVRGDGYDMLHNVTMINSLFTRQYRVLTPSAVIEEKGPKYCTKH